MWENKYSVSLVSYLNTKPFLYGLQNFDFPGQLDIQLDFPSAGAQKIMENKVDIALAPVAVLSYIKDAHIITDYCIGTENAVQSVCLFSDVPVNELKEIYLDYHSVTSVQLLKLLLREYWQTAPVFIQAQYGYIENIKNNAGGLIIGDASLQAHNRFAYRYDLGEAWHALTGYPFVFALCITRKELPADILFALNRALKYGVDTIDEVIAQQNENIINRKELKKYLTENLSYNLDGKKKEALKLFLEKIRPYAETHAIV